MKQSSVFSGAWCNLVFEGRNQNYGAFQLRKMSEKTTLSALFISVLMVASVLILPLIVSQFDSTEKLVLRPVINITPGLDKIKPIEPNVKENRPPSSIKPVKMDIFPIVKNDIDKTTSLKKRTKLRRLI